MHVQSTAFNVLSKLFFGILLACFFRQEVQAQYSIGVSSFLGDAGNTDRVTGSRIQSDGTIVLAANIGAATPGGKTPVLLNGATSTSSGAIIRLSADGKTVLSVTRVGAEVLDLAIDDANNIYVAAASGGLLKLNATASTLTYVKLAGTYIFRVDAGGTGNVAALKPSSISTADENAGNGTIYTFSPTGTALGTFNGYQNTQDVAIHEASQTVNTIGWRQANAFDGVSTQPVQIAYLRGYSYTGTLKWTAYDWSTDPASARFINKPENNMADTRGYRCSIGADGKLYAAFEVAGGNHIFRYSTTDIMTKVSIVGGDKYHDFYNTASEHKTFFARYEAGTGAYLKGQQLVNRLPDNKGNTIRVRGGEIRADASGRVYLGGTSTYGLPMTLEPHPAGTYTGGGWFIAMSSDFTTRLLVTRVNTSGLTRAIDARILSGTSANIVWAGATTLSGSTYTTNAIQAAAGGGTQDGFVVVAQEAGAVTPIGTVLSPTADAYVRNGTYAATNYGAAAELQVKNIASASYAREAYLKFDLSTISSTISTVKLRLYGNLNDATATNIVSSVYPVATTTWGESTINWNTKPAAGATALASVTVANATAAWYEWDVTTYVKNEKSAGRNVVSFALKNPATSDPYVMFSTKEATAIGNRPQLVVETSAARMNMAGNHETGTAAPESALVYPVPAQTSFTFLFPAQSKQEVSLQLRNLSGQLVWSGSHAAGQGLNAVVIPTGTLPNSIYHLSTMVDGKAIVKKVLIAK